VAWDFEYGTPYTKETEQEILASLEPDYISGITVLGGEPLSQKIKRTFLFFYRKFAIRIQINPSGYTLDSHMKKS
jgi:anaerobic ribonucleoside-triphosphate reductase activating protein